MMNSIDNQGPRQPHAVTASAPSGGAADTKALAAGGAVAPVSITNVAVEDHRLAMALATTMANVPLDPSTLTQMLKVSSVFNAANESAANPASNQIDRRLLALQTVTDLPVDQALLLLQSNPAGRANAARSTPERMNAYLDLIATPRCGVTMALLQRAGVLREDCIVFSVGENAAQQVECVVAAPIEDTTRLTLANPMFSAALSTSIHSRGVGCMQFGSSAQICLLSICPGVSQVDPRLTHYHRLEYGEPAEVVWIKLEDASPFVDAFTERAVQCDWLTQGYFDLYSAKGMRKWTEPNWHDLEALVDFTYSRVTESSTVLWSPADLSYSNMDGATLVWDGRSSPRLLGATMFRAEILVKRSDDSADWKERIVSQLIAAGVVGLNASRCVELPNGNQDWRILQINDRDDTEIGSAAAEPVAAAVEPVTQG